MRTKIGLFILILYNVLLFCSLSVIAAENKTHFIALDKTVIDGNSLGLNPGDTVYLMPGTRSFLRLANFNGDSLNYIIIKNYQAEVIIEAETSNYGILITNSSYFRFSGTGAYDIKYGIKIIKTPDKTNGLSIDGRSTDYEIDHIESSYTGFAGIMSLTQPSCDCLNNRGNFIQRNTSIHDNYIHHTGGEGLYIGHSFYTGYTKICGDSSVVLYPHEIQGLRVYNNIIDSCGWDGIQVSSTTKDCEIYNNKVTYYGMSNVSSQKYGIIIGGGTMGRCYNNSLINGYGTGIAVFGLGENYIYNNIIVNSGFQPSMNNELASSYGIFCDDRSTIPEASFYFINNTIISPNCDGIRMNSTQSKNNKIVNNLIVNPGSYGNYSKSDDSFINIHSGVDVEISNNFYQKTTQKLNFDCVSSVFDFGLTLDIFNTGKNVSEYGITTDFNNTDRIKNQNCDIGAIEYDEKATNGLIELKCKIYPNPNNGNFKVLNNFENKIQKVILTDLSGLRIFETIPNTASTDCIDLNYNINRGLYFITITVDGKNYCQKMLVN